MVERIHKFLITCQGQDLERLVDEDRCSYMMICHDIYDFELGEEYGKRNVKFEMHAIIRDREWVVRVHNDNKMLKKFLTNTDTNDVLRLDVTIREDKSLSSSAEKSKQSPGVVIKEIDTGYTSGMLCLTAPPTEIDKCDVLVGEKETEENNSLPEEDNTTWLDSRVRMVDDVGNTTRLDDIVDENDSDDDCANSCDKDKDDLDPEDVGADLFEEASDIEGCLNDVEHTDASADEVEAYANLEDGSEDGDDPIWRQADYEDSDMTKSFGSYVVSSSKDKAAVEEFVYRSYNEDEMRHPKKALDNDDDVLDSTRNVPLALARLDARGRIQLQLF